MTVADFNKRLAAIPVDAARKEREKAAVPALRAEAIYSIAFNSDTASRHLAEAIPRPNEDLQSSRRRFRQHNLRNRRLD